MMPASDIGEGHHEGEGVLIHPPYQRDCGRHGTEEQRVTSGGLTEAALAAATRILETVGCAAESAEDADCAHSAGI
jgi:hypothetical protein